MFKKLFIITLLCSNLSYSFINVKPPVIGEQDGLDGEVSLGAKYSSGNSDTASVSLSVKGQYDTPSWLVYFIGAYTYGESDGDKNTNNGLFHLRYIHEITDTTYDYEFFVQDEFNEFQDINIRNLIGANIRKRLDLPFDQFYIGLGLFYSYMEPDQVTPSDPVYRRTKINSYISFLKNINKRFFITYLGYYQPNVEDFSDFTSTQTLQFNTPLTDHLLLSLDILYQYNSTPYNDVEESDFRSTVNLKYKFK